MNKHNNTEIESELQRTKEWLPEGRGLGEEGEKQLRKMERYKLLVIK